MTLAATRRYAFGVSMILGVAATLMAVALVSALLSSPEQLVISTSDAELESLFRLIVERLATAVHTVARLL